MRLAAAGIGAEVIVAKIRTSETDFDMSVDKIVALSEAGVADSVLSAMVAAAGDTDTSTAAPVSDGNQRSVSPAGVERPAVGGTPAGQVIMRPKAIAGSTFRESLRSGGEGPEMVVIPAGSFRMGCLSNDDDCNEYEKPVHGVSIPRPFALSTHEVTFAEYDQFTHPNKVYDEGWGRGDRPVINVSWEDAQEYVAWLSSQTGAEYRLPSEAEWEYAARAGSTTKYSWGNEIGTNRANCYGDNCGDRWENTSPVGTFSPNGFGLYDMHGNVWEWVEDCWNDSYAGAPLDGSPRLQGDCAERVVRGGTWSLPQWALRAAGRYRYSIGERNSESNGFRVARTLNP